MGRSISNLAGRMVEAMSVKQTMICGNSWAWEFNTVFKVWLTRDAASSLSLQLTDERHADANQSINQSIQLL